MRTAVRDARSSAVPSRLRPSRILPPFHPPLLGPVLLLLRPSASPSFPSPSLPTFIPSHFHPSPSPPLSRIHPFPFLPPPPVSIPPRSHPSVHPSSSLPTTPSPTPHPVPDNGGREDGVSPLPVPYSAPIPQRPPHTHSPQISACSPPVPCIYFHGSHMAGGGHLGTPPTHLLGIPLLETLFLQHGAAPGAPTFF